MNLLQVAAVIISRPCSRYIRMALAAAFTCPTRRDDTIKEPDEVRSPAKSPYVPVTLCKIWEGAPINVPSFKFHIPLLHLTFWSQPVFLPNDKDFLVVLCFLFLFLFYI